MTSRTLSVVTEYLHSGDERVRRNVATALAALASRESLEQLVELALADDDEGVRRMARQEIRQLGPEPAALATDMMKGRLSDKESRRLTYALLGRLRSDGVPVVPSDRTIATRIATALASPSLANPEARWRPRWRLLLGGLVGGALGVALVTAYIFLLVRGLTPSEDVAGFVVLAGMLITPVVAFASAQRANPFPLHFDRLAGAVVECTWAAVGGVIVGALGAAVLFVNLDLDDASFSAIVAWAALSGGLAVAALRAGTVLALIGLGRKALQVALGILVGGGLGILVFSASALVAVRVFSMDSEFVGRTWLAAVPVLFGLGYVFAMLDAQTSYAGSIADRRGGGLCLGVVGVFMGLVLLGAVRTAPRTDAFLQIERTGQATHNVVGIVTLPADVDFEIVGNPVQFDAWLPDRKGSTEADYVLELCKDGGLVDSGDDPPLIRRDLDYGRYVLTASLYGTTSTCSSQSAGPGGLFLTLLGGLGPALNETDERVSGEEGPFVPPQPRLQIVTNGSRPSPLRSVSTPVGEVILGSRVTFPACPRRALTVSRIDTDQTFQAVESEDKWWLLSSIAEVGESVPRQGGGSTTPVDTAAGAVSVGSTVMVTDCEAIAETEAVAGRTVTVTFIDDDGTFQAEETGDSWWMVSSIERVEQGTGGMSPETPPTVLFTARGQVGPDSIVTVAGVSGPLTVNQIRETAEGGFEFEPKETRGRWYDAARITESRSGKDAGKEK